MKHRYSPFSRALLATLLTAGGLTARAQNVGIGTTAPDASAALDIVSSSKGVLLPRVASTGSVTTPATGLIVFQTAAPAGYYYNAGTPAAPNWQQLATASSTAAGYIQNQNAADQTANFRISGTGTVGTRIGVSTSAPQLGLDVANGTIGLRNGAAWDHLYWFHDGSTAYMRAGGAETGLALQVGASASGTYGDASQAYRDVMRLLPSGNVGIGTVSPTATLDVAGNARIEGLTTAGLVQTDANGNLSSASTASFGTNFIQNQNAAAQTGNFNINGTGVAGSLQATGTGNLAISTQGAFLQWNRTGGDGETWFLNQKGLSSNGLDGFRFGGVTQANVVTEYARFIGNGNFGLGTTAPSALLDVNGSTRLRGLTTAGVVTTDASGNLSSASAASLDPTTASNGLNKVGNDFRLGGTLTQATTIANAGNDLNVTGTGNVGIGAASSGFKLQVAGSFRSTLANGVFSLYNNPPSGGTVLLGALDGTGGNGAQLRFSGSTTSGYVDLGQSSAGDFIVNSPSGTRLTVQPGGNVGIGTTSPTARLHTRGTANAYPATSGTTQSAGLISRFQTSDNAILDLGGNSSNGFWLQSTDITTLALNYPLLLNPNGGRVGIGTTAPGAPLEVQGGTAIDDATPLNSTQTLTRLYRPGSFNQSYGAAAELALGRYDVNTATDAQFAQLDVKLGNGSNGLADQTVMTLRGDGRVGIGTTVPLAKLAVAGAQVMYSGLNNASARPAVGTARIAGEIGAVGQIAGSTPDVTADDGFLRLSAGGGGNLARKSYIDLSGFSNNSDMNENIVLGTINTERMRITNTGNVGIGTSTPTYPLDVNGSIHAVTSQGVVLDNQDRPLITRGWDAFTSGAYSGLGRWGVFMEPNNLTFGVPALGGKQFQWVTYNASSGISTTPMTLTQGGYLGIGTTGPAAKLTVQLAADADQGLRVTDGTATGNIAIQPLTGGNTGFSAINYNGYYNGGEQRFNTAKNRWRVGTDQRSTTDVFFIDTYNGTSGTTPFAITTAGNVGIGTSAPAATLEVAGYTKLDGPTAVTGATVPGIATALFTGNLPAADNTNVGVSLGGIATSRILSVSVMALSPNGNYFPPNQSTAIGFGSGYEYGYYLETASNTLRLAVGSNAANVKNSAAGAVKILVTYQQ